MRGCYCIFRDYISEVFFTKSPCFFIFLPVFVSIVDLFFFFFALPKKFAVFPGFLVIIVFFVPNYNFSLTGDLKFSKFR